MVTRYLAIFTVVLTLVGWVGETYGQRYLLRDDFNQTHRWWWYRNDGPVQPPQVQNGYLSARLENPILDEYCNVELMNYQNLFRIGDTPLWMRMRVRGTTGKKTGSWGWGLWYTENPEPGKFYDMAWFMEQLDSQAGSLNTWWRAITGQKQNSLIAFDDLPSVDNQEWHLYTIYLSADSVLMWVDDSLVFRTTTVIPQLPMAVHFWVDNHVRDYIGNKYRQSWQGANEFLMDFVEIREGEVPPVRITPEGLVRLMVHYNEIGYFRQPTPWYQDALTVDTSRVWVIATARVEQYPAHSDPDELAFAITTANGDTVLNGAFDSGKGNNLPQTRIWETTLPAGNYAINWMGAVTPTFYSQAVLAAPRAAILVADTTIETAPGGDSLTWKTYEFTTRGGRVAFYISGSADEDPTSNDYGQFSETADDDLYLALNGVVLDTLMLDGNALLGEGNTLFFTRQLEAGTHRLQLISNGTPTKNAVIIIGETESQPVSIQPMGQVIPQQFQLVAYPNPFNQEITIRVSGHQLQKPLQLVVYATDGRAVYHQQITPVADVVALRWRGIDDQHLPVPSGIYFLQISQGTLHATQKLVLVR